jgi:Rps23 Pro-64 3,4-dihydroxylase Tpa1-like proline 4-hydroxylase
MVEVFNNTLSESLIKEVKDHVRSSEAHKSNYTSWDPSVIKNSSPILVFSVPDSLKNKIITELSKNFDINKNNDVAITYCYYTKFSYIPWHEDQNYTQAITIYMNEYWDIDWGGYFAYEINNKIECIKPNYNTSVKIETPLSHAVFSVSIDAPVRETIQIFIK